MAPRRSFLKPFEKVKQKLAGVVRKRNRKSGSEDGREGREPDVGGTEVNQRNSCLHSDAEGVVEGGPGREGNDVDKEEVGQIDPLTSTPSILHSGQPNSM
jgi:hypothetical protein